MQKYDNWTDEQLRRIDEVLDAFEKTINILCDLPEEIREKHNVEPRWDKWDMRSYAMCLADRVAEELEKKGVKVYFPWQCEETGIHDLYDEEDE